MSHRGSSNLHAGLPRNVAHGHAGGRSVQPRADLPSSTTKARFISGVGGPLKEDPADVAFNVAPRDSGRSAARQSGSTRSLSSRAPNLIDAAAPKDKTNVWFVRPVIRARELAPSETVSLGP